MKVSREMKKQEALAWMISLSINQAVIDEFREHDTVFLCSGTDGSFSKLEDAELIEQIRCFEQQWDDLVYLVVRTPSVYGLLDSLLFVDNYTDEWEFAKKELKSGYVLTYTLNRDHPNCSDMGSIIVKRSQNGGLIRLG